MKLFERYKYKNLFDFEFQVIDFKESYLEESEVLIKMPNLINKIKKDINIIEFEKLLWYAHKIDKSKIQISKDGTKISQLEIDNNDILSLSKKYLSSNHSIVINYAENFHPDLAILTREFGEYFNSISYCSIFLNPPNLNCFGAHYDGVDVFALQLEGEKIWKIRKPINLLPTKNQVFDIENDVEYYDEYKLIQGDVLYIPRGFIHNVYSTDQYSLHISIGLSSNRKIDVYGEILKLIELEKIEYRKTAKGVLEKGYKYIKGEFHNDDLKERLFDPYYIKKALSQINSKKYSRLSLIPNSYIKQTLLNLDVNNSTEVIVAEGMILEVNVFDNKVNLVYPIGINNSDQWISHSLSLPILALTTLEFIRDSISSFTIEEMPGLITIESKILLAKELLNIGVLKFR